jgi:hypothetical protein
MKKIPWDWIGIVGGIAGVLIGAYSVIKSGGSGSIYIAIGMIIVFGSMGFFLYKFLWAPRINTRRLQKIGIVGKAKILEVHDTNITINNNPQLRLVLEIKNNSGEVYTTACRIVISRLKPVLFKTDMEVSVKIDPKNEKNVIVDF